MSEGNVRPLPNYEVVPLRSKSISVAVIQSRVRTVDAADPAPGRKANVEHMAWLIDGAQAWGAKHDLLVFHEFPITGYSPRWQRPEYLNVALDIPGPETEALAAKAKQYNCYVEFGCYAREAGWPGHFINMGVLLGPTGEVVLKHWKSRNWAGMGFSTTVYDVLDEYVARYGRDAVWPVARTEIGNLAIMPCLFEPEAARVYAVKGAELLIRYVPGGMVAKYRTELQAQCMTNFIYGVFANIAISPESGYIEDGGTGLSAVIDPEGRILAEASSHHETIVAATVPIASFRERHSIPVLSKPLYQDVFDGYVAKYPPNAFSAELPANPAESAGLYRKLARW